MELPVPLDVMVLLATALKGFLVCFVKNLLLGKADVFPIHVIITARALLMLPMDLFVFVLLGLLDHSVAGRSMNVKLSLVVMMSTLVYLVAMEAICVDVATVILDQIATCLTCVTQIRATMVVPVMWLPMVTHVNAVQVTLEWIVKTLLAGVWMMSV